MSAAHLTALKSKHEMIERSIHEEQKHPSVNSVIIERLKKQKLHIKEEIARMEGRG